MPQFVIVVIQICITCCSFVIRIAPICNKWATPICKTTLPNFVINIIICCGEEILSIVSCELLITGSSDIRKISSLQQVTSFRRIYIYQFTLTPLKCTSTLLYIYQKIHCLCLLNNSRVTKNFLEISKNVNLTLFIDAHDNLSS